MDRSLNRGGLRTVAAVLLVFATLLFAAPATSLASSYTLAFTGTVRAPSGALEALGVATGDFVSGTLKFDPFNTDAYTIPDTVTHAFAQSATLSFQVSHPGVVLNFTEDGAGTAYSVAINGSSPLGAIAFEFSGVHDYLDIFYIAEGSLPLLTSLDGLPTSSNDIIAFLGGGFLKAAGEFHFGSAGGVSFDLTLATTPVPAALPLFASALGGLGFVGWRRKRAKVQ
jgi:hypothetical protein